MRTRSALAAVLIGALVLVAAAAARNVQSTGPTKLTVWAGWSAGHELTTFKQIVAEYDRKHPEVEIKVVGGIDDNKIVAAIRSGTAPDVVSSFNSYNVGNYCGSGGWIDLGAAAEEGPHRPVDVPAGAPLLHAVRREALRVAAARRRLRPLLQQEAVPGGRDQEPAEDDVRAHRRREEADRARQEREDQGRRLRSGDRLLREHAGSLDPAVRRQVGRLEGPLADRQGPAVGEVGDVAEEARRLVRLRQARPVPVAADGRVHPVAGDSRPGSSR